MDKVRRRPREDAREVDENDPLPADDRTRVSRRRRRRRARRTGRDDRAPIARFWGFPDAPNDGSIDADDDANDETTERDD